MSTRLICGSVGRPKLSWHTVEGPVCVHVILHRSTMPFNTPYTLGRGIPTDPMPPKQASRLPFILSHRPRSPNPSINVDTCGPTKHIVRSLIERLSTTEF